VGLIASTRYVFVEFTRFAEAIVASAVIEISTRTVAVADVVSVTL
jgi:hypothetical protein